MIGVAGPLVDVTVTWLEMTEPPDTDPPEIPPDAELVAADDPPVGYFLYLYDAVGRDYEWTDWFACSRAEQEAFVGDPDVQLFTLLLDGWPAGFFMLDGREPSICDLAYFGLVPAAVGRGLGRWFLRLAVWNAWNRPGVRRVTVNTCTLDHPRALSLYRSVGFRPVRSETRMRRLSRPRHC